MCIVRCFPKCFPLWNPLHCPMGTVPRVLVWRTASPVQSDFVGLSSGAAPCISHPALLCQLWWVVCGVILLDVICGVASTLREGCPRTMTGDPQCWFSGHFCFFDCDFQHLCITPHEHWCQCVGRIEMMMSFICSCRNKNKKGAHHDRCLSMMVLVYSAHQMMGSHCVIVYVKFLSVGGGMVWGVWFFSSFWDRIWAE